MSTVKHILDPKGEDKGRIENLFEKMTDGNAILFLGAGASVGDKRYLSRHLIEYYEEQQGRQYGIENITEFVDILSATSEFNRQEFDSFVVECLKRLTITKEHQILASIPWREIITTNYDLLIEQAYDKVKQTEHFLYDIYTVRDKKEYRYRPDNDQIKYTKLNGCISDKKRYPLVFSTEEFNSQKNYYKTVLSDLSNLSDQIAFLSIGHSLGDRFAQDLLDKFDTYTNRLKYRKWIYTVEPYPNEHKLPYYSQQRVCIIKSKFSDFFQQFEEWLEPQRKRLLKKSNISTTIIDSNQQSIKLPPTLSLKLLGNVRPLHKDNKQGSRIDEGEFYRGLEPNYDLIVRGVDVPKSDLVKHTVKKIHKIMVENAGATFLPIVFLTGSFGTGKSTFTYRLIHELASEKEKNILAFEILNAGEAKKPHLIKLLELCNNNNVVFFCDSVEIESVFKSVLELRRELSAEQLNMNILFLIPIRENMLEKLKKDRSTKNTIEINIDSKFNIEEIQDLLLKLKNSGLINYRDIIERDVLVQRVYNEYEGDSFITLLQLVQDGSHIENLVDAYYSLSNYAREAFLYTALLHRFHLKMPVSLLRNLIATDWESFTQNVLNVEGKGILIQEEGQLFGVGPDILFKTKHPIIADSLINKFCPETDEKYEYYKKILKKMDAGISNSKLAVDLLKAIRKADELTSVQINRLYDAAYEALSDDPFFIFNYTMNLQDRQDEVSLKRALTLISYAESLLPTRNHRFVHRKALLNFELAKYYHFNEKELNLTYKYIDEAKEWFEIKKVLDPTSFYSYYHYLKFLFWCLQSITYKEDEQLKLMILIEETLDLSLRVVAEGATKIEELKAEYARRRGDKLLGQEYEQYLDQLYGDSHFRPYACILLYNYYEDTKQESLQNGLIDELEEYTDKREVVKFLFKYYGRNLHNATIRIKFYKLVEENLFLKEANPLRYNYFLYMAESYSGHFEQARGFQYDGQSGLNPEFHYLWKDGTGEPAVFEGMIIKSDNTKFKRIKIPILQQIFRLKKGNYDNYELKSLHSVRLHFYLNGIRAEILSSNNVVDTGSLTTVQVADKKL